MSINYLKKMCVLLCASLSIGGCFPPFYVYEPYPAMEYTEICIEDTPASILETVETAYPTARILTIKEESFRGHLRGYIITYLLNDITDTLFVTAEGEIVSE